MEFAVIDAQMRRKSSTGLPLTFFVDSKFLANMLKTATIAVFSQQAVLRAEYGMLVICGNRLQARVLMRKNYFSDIWKCHKRLYICPILKRYHFTTKTKKS
jgi:hypothetical protein